jgi:hypothetical protein
LPEGSALRETARGFGKRSVVTHALADLTIPTPLRK